MVQSSRLQHDLEVGQRARSRCSAISCSWHFSRSRSARPSTTSASGSRSGERRRVAYNLRRSPKSAELSYSIAVRESSPGLRPGQRRPRCSAHRGREPCCPHPRGPRRHRDGGRAAGDVVRPCGDVPRRAGHPHRHAASRSRAARPLVHSGQPGVPARLGWPTSPRRSKPIRWPWSRKEAPEILKRPLRYRWRSFRLSHKGSCRNRFAGGRTARNGSPCEQTAISRASDGRSIGAGHAQSVRAAG